MTPETVMSIAADALQVVVLMVLVMLVPSLIVGILVSVFQAATQINESTLTFIPKLLTTFAVLLVAGPWLLSLLVNYFERLVLDIPNLIG
ncbi:MAG: flagellar biosynthesis protein FliQ [Gammaproteobacteria bacterium]|nr:flagellar biosynthesis protein FliQ [Gammaproteobacteria bacterium]